MDKIREIFFPKPKPVVVLKVEVEKSNRMSWDRALLASEGAVGVGQGLSMLVNPSKAQDSVLTSTAKRNDVATRVAGSALLLTSGFVMKSGLDKDKKKNKMAARVAAVVSTAAAVAALTQLRGAPDSRATQSGKMKVIAAASAINAAACFAGSRDCDGDVKGKGSCCK